MKFVNNSPPIIARTMKYLPVSIGSAWIWRYNQFFWFEYPWRIL